MSEISDLVATSAIGTELSAGEVDVIADLMQIRELAEDEYLVKEGSADDSLHLIVAGKIEVVKTAGAGEQASLAVLREGDLAGELSFIDGEVHTVNLRSLGNTRVLSLARADFEKIVESHPLLVYKVMRAIARSAHRIMHRMNHEFVELSNYIFKRHGRY